MVNLTGDCETSQYFNLFYQISRKDEQAYDYVVKNLIVGRIINLTFFTLGVDRDEMNKSTEIPIHTLCARKK